jgi:hypothetical protein
VQLNAAMAAHSRDTALIITELPPLPMEGDAGAAHDYLHQLQTLTVGLPSLAFVCKGEPFGIISTEI